MKYKVGDKVRLKNGDLVEIKHCIQLLSMPPQDAYIVKSAIKDNGEFTIMEDTMSEVSEWSNEPKPKHPPKLKGLNTHYSMITALQEQVEIKQKEIDRLNQALKSFQVWYERLKSDRDKLQSKLSKIESVIGEDL